MLTEAEGQRRISGGATVWPKPQGCGEHPVHTGFCVTWEPRSDAVGLPYVFCPGLEPRWLPFSRELVSSSLGSMDAFQEFSLMVCAPGSAALAGKGRGPGGQQGAGVRRGGREAEPSSGYEGCYFTALHAGSWAGSETADATCARQPCPVLPALPWDHYMSCTPFLLSLALACVDRHAWPAWQTSGREAGGVEGDVNLLQHAPLLGTKGIPRGGLSLQLQHSSVRLEGRCTLFRDL